MRFKRTVAKLQIRRRKQKVDKIKRETLKLSLERNKALKEAELKVLKAKAFEEKRQAELKKLKADERLKIVKETKRRNRGKKAIKIAKGTAKTLAAVAKDFQKLAKKHPAAKG